MREAYLQNLEGQLRDWESRLASLKGSGVEEWLKRRDAAVAKLEELKASGSDRFDVLRMGVESAWAELKAAFETATGPSSAESSGRDAAEKKVA